MRVAMSLWCVSLAVASGCSFPEPTVVELAADGALADSRLSDSIASDSRADGTTVDSKTDGVVADGPSPDDSGDTLNDDTLGDGTVGDGTSEVGDASLDARDTSFDTGPPDTRVPACESGNPCDCDGDGDEKPGAGCGGTDCDDGDPRRNGKVVGFQTHDATGTTHGGDWDCSGTAEKEFGNGGFACSGVLGGAACTSAKGYTTAAASVKCGGMANIGGCKEELTVCVNDPAKAQTNQIVKCK